MNYNFTEDDIKFVEKAIELKNKGFYIDSMQLTEHYNRILNKHVNNTTCGSCMRQRVSELEGALNHYKSQDVRKQPSDSVSEQEPTTIPQEDNKAVTEPPVKANRKRK